MVFVLLSRVATGAQIGPKIAVLYTLNICDTTHVLSLCKKYVLERGRDCTYLFAC